MPNNTAWFRRILISWLIVLTPLTAKAAENHPRLFIDKERITEKNGANPISNPRIED